MSIGRDLLNVPMGQMIRQMAFAIADAQHELDRSSIRVAEMMGGRPSRRRGRNMEIDDTRVFFGYQYMTVGEAEQLADAIPEESGLAGQHREMINNAIGSDRSDKSREVRIPNLVSMLELGFTPTFYQFVDTIIEVKLAITMSESTEDTTNSFDETVDENESRERRGLLQLAFGGRSGKATTVNTNQVDASYSSKYSYSAEGASLLRTKLVPVPPPAVLEDRIRNMMDAEQQRLQRTIDDTGDET